jgi:GTP-binding protein
MPDHYRRYLINSLRESFDLPGVPIRLTVKANSTVNPYTDEGSGAVSGPPRVRAQPKMKPGEKPAHPNRVRQKPKGSAPVAAKPKPRVVAKPRAEAVAAKSVKAKAVRKSFGPSTKPGAAGPGGRSKPPGRKR